MNVRSPIIPVRSAPPYPKDNQHGYIRLALLLSLSGVVIWSVASILGTTKASADAPVPEITSAVSGYCLDDYHDSSSTGSPVYSWPCNGTHAQQWVLVDSHIEKDGKYCLGVAAKEVVAQTCGSSPTQHWAANGTLIQNRDNKQCLSLPANQTRTQLITSRCSKVTPESQSWTLTQWPGKPLSDISSPICNQASVGKRVVCYAQRQWLAWQTEPKIRPVLLNDYTDGNPHEEWCADFVSYLYAEAGSPFKGGERGNGWDEYNANDIRYRGFTYHSANSGYIPKAGDMAYFNYSGGHIELVVAGGKHPTFIYGDSGTIDPISGNGDMAENQIIADGRAGQIIYYLSPITNTFTNR